MFATRVFDLFTISDKTYPKLLPKIEHYITSAGDNMSQNYLKWTEKGAGRLTEHENSQINSNKIEILNA